MAYGIMICIGFYGVDGDNFRISVGMFEITLLILTIFWLCWTKFEYRQGAPSGAGMMRSSIRLGHAAVSREVAAGGHLRDRHAGQVRAGYQRPPGSHVLRALPESLAGVLACYELSALLQKLISGKVREVCCRVIWRESG